MRRQVIGIGLGRDDRERERHEMRFEASYPIGEQASCDLGAGA
jgi:hypothetical protein